MKAYDVIAAKRDGRELTTEEIDFFVRGTVDGSVADYQASAWLMAVFLQGMTPRETLDLTLAMRDSGEHIDLSDLPGGPSLDKHSTGGVGDKTTLVVVPILAAAGVSMLKMSGRALGFSGGTVDKLEAIPGFRTDLSLEEAKAQVRRIGAALIAQSSQLAPADKILYALRDVTATIECIPLIASSIMSKKLAAGAQRIVLDVKVGRGAFMKTQQRAEELARALVAIGTGAGVPTSTLLTAMDEPLGRMVGNALEVREAIMTLRNPSEADARFRSLCVALAARGLVAVERARDVQEGAAEAERLLASGAAAAKLAQIIAAQSGPDSLDRVESALPVAPVQHPVSSEASGAIAGMDAEAIGRLAMALGAGRAAKSDPIDPAVGIELHAKTGAQVQMGQALATLHLRASDAPRAEEFAYTLRAVYQIISTSDILFVPETPVLATIP